MAKVRVFQDDEPGPVRLLSAEESADGKDWWLITRYDDVVAALSDHNLSNRGLYPTDCAAARLVDQDAFAAIANAADRVLNRSMIAADPPDHTRLRRLIAGDFGAKRLESLRPRVQQITDELLDTIADRERADLIRAFAFPMVVRVLCALLDIPNHITDRLLPARDAPPALPGEVAYEVAVELIETRRREPAGDMVSGLIEAHADGRLSTDELVSMPVMVLFAGLSTVQLIGNGVLTLLRHPEQLDQVRRDPGLVPSAVDELLRYVTPAASVTRYATADIEIGGTIIPEGSHVRVLTGSAGHDPAKYADPDIFDIHRGACHELAFGHGIHFCIGARLAKVEGEVAIGTLLHRFPDLALAEPVTFSEVDEGIVGLERLPVLLRSS
ncbi:cytochrome P450 [Amycolatopsis aidingensis]|uniref:cytochrome P450 n=1 Tax=Amycolatopsis aidingensis TaxID=2842453 RepID=UPI001C0B675E|nr:cytochrome P450 [Amycolatopsis aidingensis]